MKKVLLVEDDQVIQMGWMVLLEDLPLQLLQARDISQARDLFYDNPDLDAVVMDGCVPGVELNTANLTMEIRKRFAGPMIAVSSEPDFRRALVQAGCDYACDKNLVPDKLIQLLGL